MLAESRIVRGHRQDGEQVDLLPVEQSAESGAPIESRPVD
jgi:hypothetical protein